MRAAIFDTNIVSGLMRKDPKVEAVIHPYLGCHHLLFASAITIYEIERGILVAKDRARRKVLLDDWKCICEILYFHPLDDSVLRCAAEIWASLGEGRSKQIGDADILIAATAIVHGCRVATVNTKDFSGIPGLDVWDVTIA